MSTPRFTTKLTETETPETSFDDDDDVGGGDDDDDNVRDEKHKHRITAERFRSHTNQSEKWQFQTHTLCYLRLTTDHMTTSTDNQQFLCATHQRVTRVSRTNGAMGNFF